jgi:hypothetical protein
MFPSTIAAFPSQMQSVDANILALVMLQLRKTRAGDQHMHPPAQRHHAVSNAGICRISAEQWRNPTQESAHQDKTPCQGAAGNLQLALRGVLLKQKHA